VFALFAFTQKSYTRALPLAALYTVLFVPFTYYVDNFAYKRYKARQERGPAQPRQPKKR
jgi:hypothetical protein